jgi:asparagine synthase (glutamine-hydrolysing)
MVWLDEIYEQAALKGCKVVLKGQFGNATISQGKILSRAYHDIKRLHFKTAYKEVDAFCNKIKFSRKKIFKLFLSELIKRIWYPRESFEDTIVQRDILNKYHIIKSMNDIFKSKGSEYIASRLQQLRFMYDKQLFIQLGSLDTRIGLYHGVIIRDPLKDKRMIELCASFPMKCFVQDGLERTAVRKYMRGIVPDAILDQLNRRGLQSADYITRLRLDWDRTKKIVLQALEEPQLLKYFNDSDLVQIKGEVIEGEIFNSEKQLIKTLMLCSCSVFLSCFSE